VKEFTPKKRTVALRERGSTLMRADRESHMTSRRCELAAHTSIMRERAKGGREAVAVTEGAEGAEAEAMGVGGGILPCCCCATTA
jgi:hypothetical protein